MTVDTETIREALEREDELLAPFRTNPAVATDDIAALELFFDYLSAALGRVEEREADLREMLGLLYADYCIKTKPGGKAMPEWFERIIRELFPETLSSAAGSGGQEQNSGRASAAPTCRERQTEGRAEE